MDNKWVLSDNASAPEVRRVVLESSLDSCKCSLNEVSSSSSRALSLSVDVLDTGEVEKLLGHGRRHQTGSSRSRDESHLNGSTLSCHFAGDSVHGSDFVSPIALSDGNDVELSHDDGSLDGSLNFLVAFPSESDVVFLVSDDGIGFEAGSLTGLGLLLDGLDLHDFFLQAAAQESIDDF